MSTVECQACPTWLDADDAIWIGDKTYCEGCEPSTPEPYSAGFCSVPMWSGLGVPAGTCAKPAFGVRPPCTMYRNANGKEWRADGKYSGFVPGLACVTHGGPPCPGIEIEPSVFSGCDQSAGDCPTCGL